MGAGGTKHMTIQDPQNGTVQSTTVPKILFSEIKFSGCSLDDAIGTTQTTAGGVNSFAAATNQGSAGIVGFGAAAVVRKGTWKGREVAVKIYYPGYDTQEFVKEVSTLSILSHPAMVKLFGICVDSGRFGLVMEYAPLGSLEDYLKGRGEQASVTLKSSPRTPSGRNITNRRVLVNKRLEDASDWPLIFRFATDISAAMAYVHSQGFLHRDLKPSNILIYSLSEKDEVTAKLCDFGAGRRGAQQMTSIVGTVPYMAPEVLQSTTYTQAIDVYSFGILLWEMVTREVPYDNMFLIDVVEFVTSGKRLHIPSYLPPQIRLLIERCWHENADMRPTFDQVHKYLKALAIDLFQLTLEAMTQQLKVIDRLKEGYLNDSMTVSILDKDLAASSGASLASSAEKTKPRATLSVSNEPIPSNMLLGRVSSRRSLPTLQQESTPTETKENGEDGGNDEDDDDDDDEYDESDDSDTEYEDTEDESLSNQLIRKQIEEKLDQGRQPRAQRSSSIDIHRQKEHIVVKKSKIALDEKKHKKKHAKMKMADIGGGIRLRTGSQTSADIVEKMNNARISTSYSSLPTTSVNPVTESLSSSLTASPSLPSASLLDPISDDERLKNVASILAERTPSGVFESASSSGKRKVVLTGALDTPFQTVSLQRDFANSNNASPLIGSNKQT
eukprot:TRINITY_DN4615_c0_g1_i2.p1 TRINITY_DN4615_c0_g1~~TRINITY_DN4615_c0_g1_i2.p1  ORF type:complete len:670 (-),score=136.64 TRINITY_DN4615_c0_g1_i2:3-2012(-)